MTTEQCVRSGLDIAKQAAASIAPAFPLDQTVAVNPWWPQRHQSIARTFAEQAVLTGETGLMDKGYYRQQWGQQIRRQHLLQAISELHSPLTLAQLEEDIQHPDNGGPVRWQTLAMLMDDAIPSRQGHSWLQEIIQQVSQFIGLYHQYPERFSATGNDGEHIYQSWLEVVAQDKGIKTLLGIDLLPYLRALPASLTTLFEQLDDYWRGAWVNEQGTYAFMRASVHQLSGWAGWQSWLDWQAQLAEQPAQYSHGLGLTAILLSWDTVLMQWLQQHHADIATQLHYKLQRQAKNIEAYYHRAEQQLSPLWVWQRALELSVHQPWVTQLKTVKPTSEQPRPALQAVFCIDVRSEPMRRALEAQSPDIETLGFAGFFGIPIAYQNYDDSILRPQLPGLLAPQLVAKQIAKQPEHLTRLTKLGWQNSLEKPFANLGMVEAGGLLKLASLFKRVVLQHGSENPVDRDVRETHQWVLARDQQPISVLEKAELGAGILKAMGIHNRLANSVLLTGHGSQTCNNHTASSLDCGACGGQTGEVNVKVLAGLLNEPEVRAQMPQFGVNVPADTRFYAAMHNTTTDEITVHGELDAPSQQWLAAACQQAQAQRAEQFADPAPADEPKALQRFFKKRATNWAQMRPEWGLSNNAGAFIAPRSLTRNLDFAGRAFLHEYHAELDPEFSQLEKIMTAPLLVMNWINLQYYGSVTAPQKYGSGNKLLHNVVGGHIGVFEGNGGDLRVGLSTQSVHDGQQFRHQPVRLSVFIQAPQAAIENIMAKHKDVASLVNNGWLFLYQLDKQQQVWRYADGRWLEQ